MYQGALIVTDEFLKLEQDSFITLPNGNKAKKVCTSLLIDTIKIQDRKKELIDKYYYDRNENFMISLFFMIDLEMIICRFLMTDFLSFLNIILVSHL